MNRFYENLQFKLWMKFSLRRF